MLRRKKSEKKFGVSARLRGVNGEQGAPFRVLDLFNGETFNVSHWAVAFRTLLDSRLIWAYRRFFLRLIKESTAELKQWSTFSVGQPSEVSNPRKTLGQHVLQKPAEKLCAGVRYGQLR